MPLREILNDAINAQSRRLIRKRARGRYNARLRSRERLSHVSVRFTALVVASAMFMEQLDGTVLATALPTMARTFHVDPLQMNVALTAYLLSLAVFIPASGKVADRFGTRTVFRAAIALFTLGSILCGLSDSLMQLVAARILQGIGGAMMVPVGRLVILRSVERSELVTAMTWLMVPAMIGPVLGPPVGGFIVTALNWRWIFYINVPVGVLGMVLATLYIRDIKEEGRIDFDGWGLLLSAISLSCLMFGLELASRGATSLPVTGGLVAVGLVAGWLYLRHSRRHAQPVLDFSLMRVPTFGLSVSHALRTRLCRSNSARAAFSAARAAVGDGAATLMSSDVPSTFSAWKLHVPAALLDIASGSGASACAAAKPGSTASEAAVEAAVETAVREASNCFVIFVMILWLLLLR